MDEDSLNSDPVSVSSDASAAVVAPCTAANCTEMGIETDIFPARGSFYVPTQAKTPYCSKYARQQDILLKTVLMYSISVLTKVYLKCTPKYSELFCTYSMLYQTK